MRRFLVGAGVLVTVVACMAGPAGAHNLTVTPGGGKVIENWVGAGDLPGQGQGLIPGGPGGTFTLAPAHGGGLVTACMSLEANPSVVDIRGPGGPGCAHGS